VSIYQRDLLGRWLVVGVLITDQTRSRIPPRVLRPAAPYLVFVIAETGRSMSRPNQILETPAAYAQAVSGLMMP
jgi:hypothetical protein